MYKKLLLLFVCMITVTTSWCENKQNVLTEEGAWCWFADPRAIHYANEKGTINNTYIGYIDVHGNIKATQIDHLRGTTNEVLIRSYFQPDDHNNPTFLVLPDERIMIFYSRHTDEPCFYYRISQKAGDITTLGKEVRLETNHNTTYPSPFILSDDPDHIYLCWRGIGWHPTIARLTMPDKNDEVRFDWGPHQIVQSQKGGRGVRPYAKYMSNGKDRIYLAYTTTHPDNQSVNYLYFNYVDINTQALKDIKGNHLATIGSETLHNVEATADYKSDHPDAVVEDAPYRNWLWEISMIDEQHPVIAMVRINEDKTSHDYYHVKWTGNAWKKTFLTNAGGHFHQTPTIEKCYSAGMAIDKANPDVIYASVPVNGKYGKVYELKRYAVGADGSQPSSEQLTFDSPKNNARPFVIYNIGDQPQMAWMHGDYYDWIVSSSRPNGYPTAIHTNMEIPAGRIDLEKDLLLQKRIGRVSAERKEKIRMRKSDSFTIAMTLSIDHNAYYGNIIAMEGFSYGLPMKGDPKPCIEVGGKNYSSTNLLANSAIWKTQNRGTGGHWYTPGKLDKFHLVITYEKGVLRTYINGLLDQSVEVTGLSLSDITIGGFDGVINTIRVYKRALSQGEIKALSPHVKPF